MKKNYQICYFLLLLFLSSLNLSAQNLDSLYHHKVSTLDQTIESLYAVISGDAEVKRDWDLFRYLFKENAQLIPTGKTKAGVIGTRYLSPDDYVIRSGPYLEENGFHEKEIFRKTEQFGNIVHIFSSYAAFHKSTDTKPFMRGMNSIQMLYDNERWWIVNIYWQAENEKLKLPEKYLKS